MSSLFFIDKATISTPASTFGINNVFSSDYSSYIVVGNGLARATTGYLGMLFLDSGGSNAASSDFSYNYQRLRSGATLDQNYTETGSSMAVGYVGNVLADGQFGFNVLVQNPYTANYTYGNLHGASGGTGFQNFRGSYVLQNTTSVTGLQLSASEIDDAEIKIYGVKDA